MNLFDLSGKTALVVGASSGLGERAAYTLSKAGAKVILASRNINQLNILKDKLSSDHTKVLALQVDISDKKSVSLLFEQIDHRKEKIDICINTAGFGKLTPVFEADENNIFESLVQTNLMGTWYVAKEVANHMKNNKIEGSIINISSINGMNKVTEGLTGYCVAKAGVIQLTKVLVGELSKFNIRINCIVPGLFHTPATHERLNNPEGRKQMEDLIPLGFVADPSDLDGLILYLASNKASRFMTGSCIVIDGGRSWGG